MQAVKARKVTEPVLVVRTSINQSSITNDLAAIWSNFGETKNMLQKLEDKSNTVCSPPRLVHFRKNSAKGKAVQFSHPSKQPPSKKDAVTTSDTSPDSTSHLADNSNVLDGDYLNNETCVLNANSQGVKVGDTAKVMDQSRPLVMEPLRSGSSSREGVVPSAVPHQVGATLHSNRSAIFGPPVNFDDVTSTTHDHPPVVTSTIPSIAPVTLQPLSHHVPIRKFQIPESALVNLKKTIAKQKLDVQASGIKLQSVGTRMEPLVTDSGEESVTARGTKPVRRKLHHTADVVVAAGDAPSGNCSKKRKIAVAPSPPNYAQARPIESNLKQPRLTSVTDTAAHHFKSKPTVRKVAKLPEPPHQGKRQTTITPSSWKAGRDVVHKILGPPKRPAKQPEDHELAAGDSSSSIASSTDSVGLAVRSKHLLSNMAGSSPKKDSSEMPLLNANAASVLSELGLSEADNRPVKPTVRPVKRSFPFASKVHNPEPLIIPRARHYDADKVRDYMERKREARKKKDMEQRYVMQRVEIEKKKKLESLDEGRRQALQNNLKRAEMKRQQELLQEVNRHAGIHVHLEEASSDSDKENILQSSPPSKKHRSALSGHVFSSSSLLDTLALSGYKQTMPQPPPPSSNQTISESVSKQRSTPSIPSAHSLRTVSPVTSVHEPDLPSSVESSSKRLVSGKFTSHRKLPDALIVMKPKGPQKSSTNLSGVAVTQRNAARTSRRPRIVKSPSATFNTKDLPGVHNVDLHAMKAALHRRQEEAVTRIQAAYRGHQVRRSLRWNLPSAAAATSQKGKQQAKTATPTAAIATSKQRVTSAGKPKKAAKKNSSQLHKPKPVDTEAFIDSTSHGEVDSGSVHSTGASAVPPWEQTGGDAMSIINIYTRQYEKLQEQFNATAALHTERCREAFSSGSLTSASQPSLTGKAASSLEQVQQEGMHPEFTPLYSESFEASSTVNHELTSTVTPDTVHTVSQLKVHPVDSANLTTSTTITEGSIDPDSLQPVIDKSETASTDSLSCVTMEEESVTEHSPTANIPRESSHKSVTSGDDAMIARLSTNTQPPLKYSPGSLEQKLQAELALLESVSDSLQQLNNVEGARAISTAQQETADLAKVLKNRQQAHELEMKVMAQKAHDEVLQAKQQLQQMQQSAAERFELLTKQSLQEQQQKIDKIQRDAEEAHKLLPTRLGMMQHAAIQTITPLVSYKSDSAASSAVVTEESSILTSSVGSKRSKQSSCDKESVDASSIPTYLSDFEDNTVADPTIGVSTATTAKSSDPHTAKSITKRDAATMVTDHVSEEINSEGDTLVEHRSSQLDSTLQNTVDSAIMDSDEDDGDGVSFRMVLPSESHRKQSRERLRSASESVSSLATSHGDLSAMDPHGSSDGEESFCDFVSRMVRQYMLEEETRAQHQQALLKLREKALQEKNKLEMQWFNIKKQKLRNKGEDDRMPPLKKKQRELMRKFQHEQAEIQRLQEASRQASQERKMLLKQQEEVSKIKKSSQAYKDKLRQLLGGNQNVNLSSVSAMSSDSGEALLAVSSAKKSASELPTGVPSSSTPSSSFHKTLTTHRSLITEDSIKEDITEQQYSSGRAVKTATSFPTYSPLRAHEELSISSISTDREDNGRSSSVLDERTTTDKDIATSTNSVPKQLKKLRISEKYLTQREKRVLKHKAAAEAALKKQRELMIREQEITKQEEEVNKIINQAMECFYQRKEAQRSRLTAPALDSLEVSSVMEDKIEQQISVKNSEEDTSSLPEDLSELADQQTLKSAATVPTTQVTELYGNESFEALEVTSQLHTATAISTAITSSTPRSAIDNQKGTISDVSDSLKMSDTLTETATTATSEASTDIEARIRMLKEQLKQRREEVKKSQQEQKRKKKDMLKHKEAELKRRIQAVESRATTLKEVTLIVSSEGSADVTESEVEDHSMGKQDHLPKEVLSGSKADSDMYGYTPFSEVTTLVENEQATTIEATYTAPVVDTSRDRTAVVTTAVDVSQLTAPPDEIQSEIIAESLVASSSTPSTVSFDHSSELYVQEDILEDTFTEPLLPVDNQHWNSQLLHSDQQEDQLLHDDQHSANDQLPPSEQDQDKALLDQHKAGLPHDDQHVDQLPLDNQHEDQHEDQTKDQQSHDETFTKSVTIQYDETFETHDDSSIKTEGMDHSHNHNEIVTHTGHSITSQGHGEVITELDDSTAQALPTSTAVTTPVHSTSTTAQGAISGTHSPDQLQPPIEAKLPLKASEVELSDSQPATEVSEASSIAESNEVPSMGHDDALSFKVGERVVVGQKVSGTIQFVGQTLFAPGTWIGVELDIAKGTNDGSLEGVRYFTCKPSHGLFAPPNKVEIHWDTTMEPTVTPSHTKSLPDTSPVSTSTLSDKGGPSDDSKVTQQSIKKTDKVEDIATDLATELTNEAVQDMTTIWCSRPATDYVQETVPPRDAVISKVTDELFALLLRSEVEMMCKINEKRGTVKTPTKLLKLSPKSLGELPSPVLSPPSPFHTEQSLSKIPTIEELRFLALDPSHVDSSSRQQQTARVMAGDISPPHSPPLSPLATAVRPLSESRSSSVESITQLLESHTVDTSRFLVPNNRATVNATVASAWDACHQLTTEKLHSEDIPVPSKVTQLLLETQNLSEEENQCLLSYQELVFKLGVEVIKELQPLESKPTPVWMPPQSMNIKHDPVNLGRVQSIVYTRLMKGQVPFTLPTARYIHGGRRICGRDIDFVDALLIKELRSAEKDWTNYDEDEELVKMQTADAILDSLLTDTAIVMNEVVSKKMAKSKNL